MENSNTSSKSSYLQFGVFFSLLMILSFVIIYVLDVDLIENPLVGTLSSIFSYFIFPVIFIYLGISTYKKNNLGFISLTECLKVGVSIVFIAALIFAIFNLIFNFIFPEYLEEILGQTRKIMLKQNPNMTDEQLEMGISMSRKFSSPLLLVPFTLLIFSFLGLIYSLIIGLIVKKDKAHFN